MKRRLIFFLFVFILSLSLASPVFASDTGTGEEPGGGFTFETIGEFIKGLFIPDDDYFTNKTTELNNAFESKVGGLLRLSNLLSSFWNDLGKQSQGFIFSLPSGHFFGSSAALNINLFGFEHSSSFLTLIRGVGNTFIILLTAIVCYHKLRTLLAKDGAD